MTTSKPPESYDRDVARAREAKAHFHDRLMGIPGVHGIGIGYKRVGGQRTQEIAVVVHVRRKLAREAVDVAELVPERLTFPSRGENQEATVSTDVREVSVPVEEVKCDACDSDLGDKVRPVPGGYSVGLSDVAGGTLGGWVWDRINDQMVLISNHHVLGGTAGDTVIQPSIGDGGAAPADTIGEVVRAGTLDVAIARAFDGDDISATIQCSTPGVFEIADATIGMEIEKAGQTTGLTCGLVELIDYDSEHYGSHNDLWIDGDGSDFSDKGDSGSLYVERHHPEGRDWKRVVGIHWGGSDNDGIGHPIRAAFQDLDVATLCTGLVEALLEALFGSASEEGEGLRQRIWPRRDPSRRGLARDLERRIRESAVGGQVASAISEQRVALVRVLSHGDGRRAALAFLRPILKGAVTTDDVLDRAIGERDVANARRLLKVVRRVSPELGMLSTLGETLLDTARGATIGDVLHRGVGRTPGTPTKPDGRPRAIKARPRRKA